MGVMLSNSLQGIGLHYIFVPDEQRDIARDESHTPSVAGGRGGNFGARCLLSLTAVDLWRGTHLTCANR